MSQERSYAQERIYDTAITPSPGCIPSVAVKPDTLASPGQGVSVSPNDPKNYLRGSSAAASRRKGSAMISGRTEKSWLEVNKFLSRGVTRSWKCSIQSSCRGDFLSRNRPIMSLAGYDQMQFVQNRLQIFRNICLNRICRRS